MKKRIKQMLALLLCLTMCFNMASPALAAYYAAGAVVEDDGTEFSDADGMERSRRYKKRQRTQLYYCHPRVPEERGSNENMNKLLRRWIPKGVEMDTVDPEYIQFVQDWINNYPRRLFGGLSAQAMVNKIFDVA